MKQQLTTGILLCLMAFLLGFSEQAAQAVRQALQLCAVSVIPSLFPFFVLTGLFIALSPSDFFPPLLSRMAGRLWGCSSNGLTIFFLGILGGYPLGARMISQLHQMGRLRREEAQNLLLFCNNAGPAFILGMVGLGRFGSVRVGIYLYLIHVFCAAMLGILFRKAPTHFAAPQPLAPSPSFSSALVNAIASAGSSMVQICSFVVFFVTLLQLFSALTSISHPLLFGAVELTNGILRLGSTPLDFAMAAALLGWGGISVHLQTAAVLQDTPVLFVRYLCAKSAHAGLSFCAAFALSPFIF